MEASLKDYSGKSIKTFTGREGYGFNVNLYRGKKKVAMVYDDASGGGPSFNWLDWKQPRVGINSKDFGGEPNFYDGTPEEKIFVELVAQIPPLTEGDFKGYNTTPDCYIEDLVNNTLDERRFKRLCKKKTVFIIKGKKGNEEWSNTTPYSVSMKLILEKRYGDRLIEIINERFKDA